MVTRSAPEAALTDMVDELVKQFDPERVYLLDVLVSGDQRVWHEANFLVVLDGEWDYREKRLDIGMAMPRTGFGKFFHVITPQRFEQYQERAFFPPHFNLSESRVLYERD